MTMKMIIAIVNDDDSELVSKAITGAGFRVTTIASTGGFLRKGKTTMLSGVEDDELEKALDVLRSCFPPQEASEDHRCTIFVLNISEAHHF
jgi:uncharacterized protein YaaQ